MRLTLAPISKINANDSEPLCIIRAQDCKADCRYMHVRLNHEHTATLRIHADEHEYSVERFANGILHWDKIYQ